MAKLSDSASIFQLSFAINSIISVVIHHYYKNRNLFNNIFIRKLESFKEFNPKKINKPIVKKAIFKSANSPKILLATFYSCISISAMSIIASAILLFLSASSPDYEISNFLLFLYVTLFLFITPAVYFSFYLISNKLPNLARNEINFTLDDVHSYNNLLELVDLGEEIKEMNYSLELSRYKRKIKRAKKKIKRKFPKTYEFIDNLGTKIRLILIRPPAVKSKE